MLFLFVLAATALAADYVEVDTEYGRIRGIKELNPPVTAFYGVPFAKPPLGDLRWALPVQPEPWTDTRDCTRDLFFHVCPQFYVSKGLVYGQEDCLYMNIYVPNTSVNASMAVMFWIYGGGFQLGDGFEFGWYRGKNIAANQGVIVVEHNYRIAELGFLHDDALRLENSVNSTGNYGVQDQQAALNFTHTNILAFGGDPQRITIFGESAGAMSVCWHLVSPVSRGLFSRAIMESGSCSSAEFFISPGRAAAFSTAVANKLGCVQSDGAARLVCMRKQNFHSLFMREHDWQNSSVIPPIAPLMPWGPSIDGSAAGLLARPINLMQQGLMAAVPLIVGTNHDEGSIFVPAFKLLNISGVHWPPKPADTPLYIGHVFNASATAAILSAYPSAAYKSEEQRLAVILRDYFFLCGSRVISQTFSAAGNDVYLYQFVYNRTGWVDYNVLGDYHTFELSFVFDNQWPPLIHDFNARDHEMADTFGLYWGGMAKYGSPNGNLSAGAVPWPTYTIAIDPYLSLTVPPAVGTGLNTAQCATWNNIYPAYYFDD